MVGTNLALFYGKHNKAPAQGGGNEVTHSINPMATVVSLWVQARFPRVKDGPKTGNHIDVINIAIFS